MGNYFLDTDSLTYEISGTDILKDFWIDGNLFDFSNYDKGSEFYSNENNKVIGNVKDEAGGLPIVEFIGLRSKMYSYVKDDGRFGKTAKGIKKNVIKKEITHKDYKQTLFNNNQMRHKMKCIRSNKHQIGSYEINKTSLSCFDDKRYILEDGFNTFAYGHYKTKNL